MKMVATRDWPYRKRKAGETFNASRPFARTWKALGYAREAAEPMPAAAPVAAKPEPEPSVGEVEALRYQYERESGRLPDKRWGVRRLRDEIGRYLRRDMRAED